MCVHYIFKGAAAQSQLLHLRPWREIKGWILYEAYSGYALMDFFENGQTLTGDFVTDNYNIKSLQVVPCQWSPDGWCPLVKQWCEAGVCQPQMTALTLTHSSPEHSPTLWWTNSSLQSAWEREKRHRDLLLLYYLSDALKISGRSRSPCIVCHQALNHKSNTNRTMSHE